MPYQNKTTHQIVQAFYWQGNASEIDAQKKTMGFNPADITYFKGFTKAMRNHWIVQVEADSYRYQIMTDADFKAAYQLYLI